MKRLILILMVVPMLCSGCIPLLVGAGVVTGYSLSNDAAIGNLSVQYDRLWKRCELTLEKMQATILEAKQSKGLIKARMSDNDVTIRIDTIDNANQRLRVSARRFMMPKPQFAQKVFFKITENLK
ncbi:MAG: DUF3568 family protein [Candidatus Omnitrophota bacterium]|nr:DUF3568 domain-containing protein [Candidatus Omnitrophota bacterium]